MLCVGGRDGLRYRLVSWTGTRVETGNYIWTGTVCKYELQLNRFRGDEKARGVARISTVMKDVEI